MNLSPASLRLRPRPLPTLTLVLALALSAGAPAAHGQKAPAKKTAPSAGSKHKLPPEDKLKEMVRQTLLDLDKGLETKDFTQLYDSFTPATRKNFTKEQIAGSFAGQIAQDQRTDYAANTPAVFDPAPSIDERGILTTGGHVPSEPQWVVFRIKYADEGGGWKPYALTVRVQNSNFAPSRLPEPGEKEGPPAKPHDANPSPSPSPTPTPAAGTGLPGYNSPFGAPPAASPSPAATSSPASSPSPDATSPR